MPLLRPESIPGLHVVRGRFGQDAAANLLWYADRHLDGQVGNKIKQLLEEIESDLRENRTPGLHFSTIVPLVVEKHRDAVTALLRDLEVSLLSIRYDMLRRLNAPALDEDADEMLERYWLRSRWLADPEMPQVVARVLVRHLSQWDLMCLLHDRIRDCISALRPSETHSDGSREEAFHHLGRLMGFLRWVPYDWVEDVLVDFVRQIDFADNMKNLRFHVSVLRALFCRAIVRRQTVETLCESLFERFGNPLPVQMHRPLRGVLVAGGEGAWQFIERKLREQPQRYLTPFFLEIMAWIDKGGAARLFGLLREAMEERLEAPRIIRLLADTGERDATVADRLLAHWNDADSQTKLSILEAVDELHCEAACSRLLDELSREHDRVVKVAMLDTLASVCTFEEAITLAARVSDDAPLVYYHAIDSVFRRLLANPVMLTRLEDFHLLYHLERARERVYRHYLCTHHYRTLVKALCDFMERCADIDGLGHVSDDFEPLLDDTKRATCASMSPDTVSHITDSHAAALAAHQTYRADMALAEEVGALLESAAGFQPRHADGVFGGGPTLAVTSPLPSKEDLMRFSTTGDQEQDISRLRTLCRAADNAVALLQRHFVFKEWFVRAQPFILNEDIPETVRRIEEGEPLAFDPDAILDTDRQAELRKTFAAFAECTRHGVYLTEVILERLRGVGADEAPRYIENELTHLRSLIARGECEFDPYDTLACHVQFTTYAHVYRYGKESLEQPSIVYIWLRYLTALERLRDERTHGRWPRLPHHPEAPRVVGPLTAKMYRQQREDARGFLDFVMAVYDYLHPSGIRIRVIPNITYGLFCLAPVIRKLVNNGIHVSLAGISSRFCDDMNISEFNLNRRALFPVKTYLFSTASNYGTLNHDRVLIVVDGTMEPVDRHDPSCIRLPKAHRGYLNHIVAINYVRSRYGYGMHNPLREVASALNLPLRYVRNLASTADFHRLVRHLLLSFDPRELTRFHRRVGTGHTYYGYTQWNPDGLPAIGGPRGFSHRTIPCAQATEITAPALIFASINGYTNERWIPAFFDNSPEVERPRIVLGPDGAKLDTGWPHEGRGIVAGFPEGENR